ncbi:MAG: PstS family phosphate ABC transporter substrate-binding protein [Chloroflexaceae bacterium]|nr:PstS family phosphate ABC transporter substrate-binding protein [Chloroflexaceae bacterium]
MSLKRPAALLLMLVLLVPILVACAGGGGTPSTPAADTEPTATEAAEAETTEPEAEETTEPEAEETTEPEAEETTEPEAEPTPAEEEPTEPGMSELPPVDPAAVEGDIISAGSSTVFPLAERIATEFRDEGYAGQITIDSIGSGAGFERFCVTAETDVANASRAIRPEEISTCQDNGRDPIEYRIGTDALAVVVSTENDFLEDVTMDELMMIFSEAETWADVNAEWPAEPIQRFVPGTDSGTFDYFVEEIFEEDPAPILNASNLQQSEDDNVLVQGVESSPYAIGFFGFAYYAENQDLMRAVAIEGVEPNAEAVDAGEYPLARPLFMYSDATIMTDKPQVADYLNYVLTNVNSVIDEVGYFPASDEALNESRMKWMEAMGMN